MNISNSVASKVGPLCSKETVKGVAMTMKEAGVNGKEVSWGESRGSKQQHAAIRSSAQQHAAIRSTTQHHAAHHITMTNSVQIL